MRLYTIISNLFSIKKGDSDVPTYLGRIQFVVTDFNDMLPVTINLNEQKKQRDKLFMVLTLAGLRLDIEGVQTQILSSPTIPTVEEVFARILRSAQVFSEASIRERSILASQIPRSSSEFGPGGSRGRGAGCGCSGKCPYCNYCCHFGHYKDTCYALHGRPSKANVAIPEGADTQSMVPDTSHTKRLVSTYTISVEELAEYRQF